MGTKPSQDQVLVLKRLPQFECNMGKINGLLIVKPQAKSHSQSNPKEKWNLASGLSLKSHAWGSPTYLCRTLSQKGVMDQTWTSHGPDMDLTWT